LLDDSSWLCGCTTNK